MIRSYLLSTEDTADRICLDIKTHETIPSKSAGNAYWYGTIIMLFRDRETGDIRYDTVMTLIGKNMINEGKAMQALMKSMGKEIRTYDDKDKFEFTTCVWILVPLATRSDLFMARVKHKEGIPLVDPEKALSILKDMNINVMEAEYAVDRAVRGDI